MNNGGFSKLVLTVVSLLLCFSCTNPAAAENSKEPESAGVANLPVFFATDRLVKKKGGGYKFGEQVDSKQAATTQDGLTFGIEQTFTTVPWSRTLSGPGSWQDVCANTIEAVRSESSDTHGWRTMSNNGTGSLYGWSEREKFFDHLNGCVSKCPEKELIIFVHGCCVDHDKAVQQTLGLQKWYRRPVLLFDWTTINMVYFQSLRSYPKSQDRFNLLVNELRSRMPDVKITVIAFSIGTNIVKNYCLNSTLSANETSFDGLIFLRGDADSGSFQKELPVMARHSKRPLQIWVASNDFNINISRLMRRTVSGFKGCNPRVGQLRAWTDLGKSNKNGGNGDARECSVTASELLFDGIEVMDVSELRLGHRIPYRLLALASRRQLVKGDIGPFLIDEISTRVFKAHQRLDENDTLELDRPSVQQPTSGGNEKEMQKIRSLVTAPGAEH